MTTKYIVLFFRMYGVFNMVFGLMAIAIAVTAFRRGERWAWWTLLVGTASQRLFGQRDGGGYTITPAMWTVLPESVMDAPCPLSITMPASLTVMRAPPGVTSVI